MAFAAAYRLIFIYELVAYAASKGLRPVFGTNGMLITKEVAQKLKDSGAAAMGISLDSLNEEKHNHFRGLFVFP